MKNDFVNIENNDDVLVVVRRQPADYRTAVYRLSEIGGLHWSNRSGGVKSSFMKESIYGYVNCEGAVSGEVSHSGIHGRCPHNIKVCALKKDNEENVYEMLVNIVGPRPNSNRAKPSTGNMCKVDIVDILKKKWSYEKLGFD